MNIKKGLPKSQTKTPKSFSDCQITDSVSEYVLKKADALETWGALLVLIIIVLGVISAFGSANVVEVRETYYGSAQETKFSLLIFAESLIKTGICAFITFCVYNFMVTIIIALAAIVQNTKVTANIALYKGDDSVAHIHDKRVVAKEWTCEKCGTSNEGKETFCKNCGEYR